MFGDYGKMTVEEFLLRSQLQAMHQAISLTFERALKSDIYLQAAKRGKDDFYFLLDSNSAMLAESVLGLYQRIFNEIVNVDPSLQEIDLNNQRSTGMETTKWDAYAAWRKKRGTSAEWNPLQPVIKRKPRINRDIGLSRPESEVSS